MIFIIIVTVSCNHSDTPKPQSISSNCQLTEYQESDSTQIYREIYYYEKLILKGVSIFGDFSSKDVTIERNNDGQIQSTDWLTWYMPEFFYDSKGHLKKIVITHFVPGGPQYSYEFFEYDSKGQLSQLTRIPEGNHGLEEMYNPDFKSFISAAISKYDSITNYSKKESFEQGLKYTTFSKYLVDKNNFTVTEIRNMSSGFPDRKLGDRMEKLWKITKYDGKNSPYNSADRRSLNMFLGNADPIGDSFSELGNVLEKSSTLSGFSRDNSQRSYIYNSDGYPISGTHVDKYIKLHLTWKYNCQ